MLESSSGIIDTWIVIYNIIVNLFSALHALSPSFKLRYDAVFENIIYWDYTIWFRYLVFCLNISPNLNPQRYAHLQIAIL